MLYQGGLYNEIRLGSGSQNVAVGFGPVDLNAYQNTTEDIIVYWTVEPYSSDMDTRAWIWEVETSLSEDFSDPINYLSTDIGAERYLSGVIYKGMVIPSYPRSQGEALKMYWRVRVRMGENLISGWTVSQYDIMAAVDVASRDASLGFLPDVIYDKSSNSNIFKLHDAFAKEIGVLSDQAQFAYLNTLTNTCRDAAIIPNFGDLLGIVRPEAQGAVPAMSYIDYRSILRAYMSIIRTAPTMNATSLMVHSIYRSWPVYYKVAEAQDDYIVTSADVDQTPYFVYDAVTPPPPGLDVYVLNRQNIDFGVIIEIAKRMSPANNLIITDAWAQEVVKRMIQAHVPVYFRYV